MAKKENRKNNKKKVYHRSNRLFKKEAKQLICSTGLYVHYTPLERDATLKALSAEGLVYSEDREVTMEKAEKLIAYRDRTAKKYSKSRKVGKKGKEKDKAYRNIYAHQISFALPKEMKNDDIDIQKFVRSFLKNFDSRTGNLVWAARKVKQRRCTFITVTVFTRPVLKEPVKRSERYTSDYYWDPETKKRTSKNAENAVLLHKKGEVKKDENGNEITETVYCGRHDLGLFRYTKKCDYSNLSGFEAMMEFIKNIFAQTLSEMKGKTTNARNRIRKIAYRQKKYSQSTILKVKAANRVIEKVNEKLAVWNRCLTYGGFIEDREIMQKWKSLLSALKQVFHGDSFTYHGIKVRNNFRGYLASYRERVDLMERRANELIDGFRQFYEGELALAGLL